MNEIIEVKIQEVCGDKQLKDMYMVDVQETTKDVFRKLNYNPSKNIDKSIDMAWANSNREDYLWEFIFKVWEADK